MIDLLEGVLRIGVNTILTVFELVMDVGVAATESRRWRLWGLVWLGGIAGVVAWAVTSGPGSWCLLLGLPGFAVGLGAWLERLRSRQLARDAARLGHEDRPASPRDPDEGNVPNS